MPEATPCGTATHRLRADDPIDSIELAVNDVLKVGGALRAVASIARAWRTADHEPLEMVNRSDLADLLDLLHERQAETCHHIDRMVAVARRDRR